MGNICLVVVIQIVGIVLGGSMIVKLIGYVQLLFSMLFMVLTGKLSGSTGSVLQLLFTVMITMVVCLS